MRRPAVSRPSDLEGGRAAAQLRDLIVQIDWFNRLRLGAVVGMIVLGAIASSPLFRFASPWPFFGLAALTLSINLTYMAVARYAPSASVRSARRLVDLQIAVDLLILTGLLHYSGGIASPLLMFYLFHAFIAALLLSVRAALVVVAASMCLAGGLGILELNGVLEHRGSNVQLYDFRAGGLGAIMGTLGIFALVQLTSVYFVSTVVARLRGREAELVELHRQLGRNEKLVAVGTLAAGVSHEINNPVGVIRNKVQVLRYRLEDGDGIDLLRAELDAIDKHSVRIADITQGLLAFSRETPFETRSLDINSLAREAVDLVRTPFANAHVQLDVTAHPACPHATASHNHLLQVLVNLLLNARDASSPGSGVSLTVEVEDRRVGLTIRDRGDGIPAGDVDKIFDPFFTTKDVGKGTGLGLAISHGIVTQHGGTIEVDSVEGQGAAFTVWLNDS